MAAICRKSRVLLCFLFTLSLCVSASLGLVHELNKASITKFLKGKLLTLTFVDSPTCTRCRVLYPFFVAASQVFPHDPEIFFTRTHDPHLVQDWGITELPALIYHRDGKKNHEIMKVDITVDDIIDEIARILFGNFAGLTRTYCVHVDDTNYDELIVTPKQSVMLLIHKKNDDEVFVMEKVAYAFRKDDAILFATLDASKHKQLRDNRFLTKDTPVVMWYGAQDKPKPKRFGGVLALEALVMFVNERTGLNRDHDGAMQQEAGRVPEADELIEENFDKIMVASVDDLKPITVSLSELKEITDSHLHEMLDYYSYILDSIAMTGSARVMRDLLNAVETELYEGEEISTKFLETLKRRRHILQFFRQLEKNYSEERKKSTREELQQKLEEERGKTTVVVLDEKDKHTHMHEEL